jgi:hypothetical protein
LDLEQGKTELPEEKQVIKKRTDKESRAASRELNLPNVQADNDSIAIGEINILGNVTGNVTIGHTIVQPHDVNIAMDDGQKYGLPFENFI